MEAVIAVTDVDPGLDDHRIGHWFAARLVDEAHGYSGIAFLQLDFHRLECVVIGPCQSSIDGYGNDGATYHRFGQHGFSPRTCSSRMCWMRVHASQRDGARVSSRAQACFARASGPRGSEGRCARARVQTLARHQRLRLADIGRQYDSRKRDAVQTETLGRTAGSRLAFIVHGTDGHAIMVTTVRRGKLRYLRGFCRFGWQPSFWGFSH